MKQYDVCPECGDVLITNLNRCVCGWILKQEKNKFEIDYQCAAITKGKRCENEGTSTLTIKGKQWYCIAHASSAVEPRQKNVSPLLLSMGIK